jgi:hypothetical protein
MMSLTAEEIVALSGRDARREVRNLEDAGVVREVLTLEQASKDRVLVVGAAKSRLNRLGSNGQSGPAKVPPKAKPAKKPEAKKKAAPKAKAEPKPKKKAAPKKAASKAVKDTGAKVKSCPKCGLTAEGEDRIGVVFGYRNVKYKTKSGPVTKSVPQSHCRDCRKTKAKKKAS